MKSVEREDAPALDAIVHTIEAPSSNTPTGVPTKYLEVGAGLGRFPLKLRTIHPKEKLDIECLEVNTTVAQKLTEKGFKTAAASATKMPYADSSFDIVHCAHVIEHFSYPEVTLLLEELFRVVKPGGIVIIRSPLMYPGFYNELDHIKPYPPKAIMHYFTLEQQQKQGAHQVNLISNWNRREGLEFSWPLPGISIINRISLWFWTMTGWPRSKTNGYVAVFTKE